MRIRFLILFFIPFLVQGQVLDLSPDSTLYDMKVLGSSVSALPCDTVTNLVTNSGVVLGGTACNTDWIDTNADGVADDWTHPTGAGTPSIVTGNGFIGNAQRVTHILGTLTQLQYFVSKALTAGLTYRITLKYRSDISMRIYLRGASDAFPINLVANTGNAIEYSQTVVCGGAGAEDLRLNIYGSTAVASGYYEIDEVLLVAL